MKRPGEDIVSWVKGDYAWSKLRPKFLDEVPHDGGLGGREMFGCIGEGDAWLQRVVTRAYGLEPCGMDWEPCRGMEVPYQICDAG